MSKIQEVATAVERGKSKKVAGLVQEEWQRAWRKYRQSV